MNAAAFAVIHKRELVHYVGPINPPALYHERLWSKLRRATGSPGSFFSFSEHRLKMIADEVFSRCQPGARLDFFHGFTPWIATRPERPYVAWSDCTFRDYVEIYHPREQFLRHDLERIEQAEAGWLKKAECVLFTSKWAVERAVHHYSLDADKVASVGIFGEMEMPARDVYAGGREFVFVSTNFEAKGGHIVLAAFRQVRQSHSDASLIIIGDRPPRDSFKPGVRFAGFLRKEVPGEYQKFREIIAKARAVVSATKADICPLFFVEAGYFGCPVISTRRFAIPEIVEHERTGFLVDDPPTPDALAVAMSHILEMTVTYPQMRQGAWAKARSMHSREQFEQRMCSYLEQVPQGDSRELATSK